MTTRCVYCKFIGRTYAELHSHILWYHIHHKSLRRSFKPAEIVRAKHRQEYKISRPALSEKDSGIFGPKEVENELIKQVENVEDRIMLLYLTECYGKNAAFEKINDPTIFTHITYDYGQEQL